MIWATWRQHRAEAAVGSAILAALVAAMLVVGSIARDRARGLGLPACTSAKGDCSDALNALHGDFHSIPPFTSALIIVPLIAGMFWAAPLVSREYENGTHRLAWTQSISPLRWISTKIVLIFAVVAAAALVLGLLATWTLDPLTSAFGGRYNSSWYDVQGIVPVACILFALAVGVAASALIRRTIPAMAVTLLVYAAVRIPVHWIRWHFASLSRRTVRVPLSNLLNDVKGSPSELAGHLTPLGASVHGVTVTGPNGHAIGTNQGNFNVLEQYCPNLQVNPARDGVLHPAACASRIQNLSLQVTAHFQPASHFWLIQIVESAIFVGLAALLVTVAIVAVNRRRPT